MAAPVTDGKHLGHHPDLKFGLSSHHYNEEDTYFKREEIRRRQPRPAEGEQTYRRFTDSRYIPLLTLERLEHHEVQLL